MAAEFVASAAANTVGNLVTEYATPYLSYFFRFGKIVEDFKNRRHELVFKKDQVQNDVDKARRQTEEIEKDVEDWLTRAEKELGETQSLEDEIDRNKCFKCCPNWGWRYCLSKKIAKKTLNISQLLEACNFSRVGHPAPLQGIEFLPSKDFRDSESSKLAFNGIMEAINANGVNMIGLYGMPGVGKTTLAKKVGKHAEEQKLFDKVVMFTMSQTPNINKIQDKIADMFSLKFGSNSEEGKAEELWRRMKGEKKILIIIDDVWEEFKLEIIGIPFGVEHEGCKILLTTRLQQVCIKMNCQKEIQLNILSKSEAWALFKDNAGLEDVSSILNDVAKEVAGECKGLPLAIVTMAKALKGESLDGWRAENLRLKESRHLDNQDVCGGMYRLLKLSYDHLKKDYTQPKENDIQLCFLLCSLFPEDHDISIESLTFCGIGVGLFSNIYLIDDVRREIRVALRKLQKSGLLLETYDEEMFRMHDVVRDFAHWLTSMEENKFMVKDGLTEWPMVESFGCYTAIALWNCGNMNNFPIKLEFSKLKILFLRGKNSLEVPTILFDEMKALQVLHLSKVVISLEGLQSLTNLRTLWLVGCELKNISSSLRNMRNLEILALFDTNIHELPEELVELSRLKSLYLSCHRMPQINFSPNLLSRLTSLQELHVTSENNVNLLELNSLSRLTTLILRVSANQCFQDNFVFPKLQRYVIVVNKEFEILEGLTFRTLKINNLSSSLSAFKDLFCNVEKLTLENVSEQKNIVPNIAKEGVNELTSLELISCEDMEFLIDITREQGSTTAFSNLVELNMDEMTCFKELCHGPLPTSFLQKLETLTIRYCYELIIAVPTALQNLKQVSIKRCEQLQVIFQLDGLFEKAESQAPLLSNLTSLNLKSLPKLKSIWKLEPSHQAIASLRSLKVVKIQKCNKLKSIFSHCLTQSLLHLQELKINNCSGLKKVFGFAQKEEMAELEETLSNLTWLELESLPRLRSIWKGPTHFVNLQSLKIMKIWECNELAYLFSTPLAQTLVHLEELKVESCDSLEQLIIEAKNEDEICVSDMKNHYPLCWPKLKTLEIMKCESLKYVFPNTLAEGLPCLESVDINDCPQLIQVFSPAKERDIISNGILLKLPSLQYLLVQNCPQLTFFIVQAQLMEHLYLSHVGNSCQLCNTDVPILDQDYIAVGNHHEEVFHVKGGYSFSSIKELHLQDFSKVRIIWKDLAQVVTLENLTTLEVIDCKKLRYIFSPTTVRGLSQLVYLDVHGCEELDQIILAKDQISSSSNGDTGLQPISFPNLTRISITYCKKLKSLFPLGSARSLAKLECLVVGGNSKLEQVFELEDEAEVTAEKEIKFDKLKELALTELPGLIDFCPKGYHFVLSTLRALTIRECPKMTTGFFIDSKHFVHSKTEIPRLVEQDATEGSATAQNAVHNMNIFWNREEGGVLPHYKEE